MTTNEEERFFVFSRVKAKVILSTVEANADWLLIYGVSDRYWEDNWSEAGLVFDCITKETAEELARILNKADRESSGDK